MTVVSQCSCAASVVPDPTGGGSPFLRRYLMLMLDANALSLYRDVLELKQLRLCLPRTAPCPTPRQPFTTSLPPAPPDPSPGHSPSFPYSRFATQPSHTPARWKNRRADPEAVDPAILPYLDAVPIRLLPLLDTPSEPEPEPEPEPSPPRSPPLQPDMAATSLAPSPTRLPIPEIHVRTPSGSSTDATPPSPPTPTLTPSRLSRTFAFLPLLPVQETPPRLPEPQSMPAPPPKQRLNMMFVPLMDAPEAGELVPGAGEPCGSQRLTMPEAASHSTIPMSPPTTPSSPLHTPSSPAPSASPSDTEPEPEPDTETDMSTDTTDTDVASEPESDTPALTNAGDEQIRVRSPGGGYFAQAGVVKDKRVVESTEVGEYFSSRGISSGPGATPPLSALYPSPTSPLSPRSPRSPRSPTLVAFALPPRTLALRALPSPALAPPSPFSLYPPTPAGAPVSTLAGGQGAGVGLGLGLGLMVGGAGCTAATTTTSATTITTSELVEPSMGVVVKHGALTQMLSEVEEVRIENMTQGGKEAGVEMEGMLRPSLRRRREGMPAKC
ncbi:hypothetical protein AcW2_010363 [Taiwanofungus camphoratus]|nr:hypothetical protein AcW2_010363 [Antrodia cinnamomea]